MAYRNCPHCQASNRAADPRCYSCGQEMAPPAQTGQGQAAEDPPVLEETGERKRSPWLVAVLMVTLVLVGVATWWVSRDDTSLRAEVARLHVRGNGLIPSEQPVKPGDTLFLDAAMRGWTPNAAGNCSAVLRLWVEGEVPLYFPSQYATVEFRKNSRITHIPITERLSIPNYAISGDYTVHIKLEDKVAESEAEFTHTFRVEAPEGEPRDKKRQACLATLRAITEAAGTDIVYGHEIRPSLRGYEGTHFPVPLTCPLNGEAAYTYKSNGSTVTVSCESAAHDSAAPLYSVRISPTSGGASFKLLEKENF